jgi:hypothetical protein
MTRKCTIILLILNVLYCCGTSQERTQNKQGEGAKVHQNTLQETQNRGDLTSLTLRKEFSIDTEEAEIISTGLMNIEGFDVDSNGNILCLGDQRQDKIFFLFDRDGRFIQSFGRKGQGPGELRHATFMKINESDEVVVTDSARKLLFFKLDGELIREIRLGFQSSEVIPLENGTYLIYRMHFDPENDFLWQKILSLYNGEIDEIKELDRQRYPNYMIGKATEIPEHVFFWRATANRIFIGKEERGYEIDVYDLDGTILNKIHKDNAPVPISDKHRKRLEKEIRESADPNLIKNTRIKKYWPPYQAFFVDEENRLFVLTTEEEEGSSVFFVDVFNERGTFITRMQMKIKYTTGPLWATVKGNRLYCLQEKDSGFLELVVYRLQWS